MASQNKDTVCFRLPPTFMRQLTATAEERKAGSRHNLARQFVIDALNEPNTGPRIDSLQEQVYLLREDVVTAVAYALQLTGKMNAKDARRTAEQIFRKDPTE